MMRFLKTYGFILLFCWAAFLLLKGLGFAPLWGDEASTAWYARNITHVGVPTAWDGKNVFAPFDGAELNDQLILAYIPWFHYYIAAGSIAVFGDSAWAARLPFSLIALVSVVFFFGFLQKMFAEKKLVYFGTIFYIHTLPFLINSRQCRYYSLLILFTSAWLWIVTHLENKKRIVWLSILFTVYLHTHYFIAACFVGALILTGLCCKIPKNWWKEHFISLCFAAAFFLPWFYFYNPWRTTIQQLFNVNASLVERSLLYLHELNINLIFPALLVCLLPVVFWGSGHVRKKQIVAGMLFFISFMICLIGLDSSGNTAVRYTLPLIPVAIFLWVICLEKILSSTLLQGCALILLLSTDIATLPMFTKHKIFLLGPNELYYHPKAIAFQRFPWRGFWNTLWNDFPKNYDVASDLIRKHVPKGSCITTYPGDLRRPLLYLLSQDYKFCSQLYPRSMSRFGSLKNPALPDSIFAPPKTIEAWLIVFGNEGVGRYTDYDELAPNAPGTQLIDVGNWDSSLGMHPVFTVFQTEELPLKPGDPRAIRLYHYIPPKPSN